MSTRADTGTADITGTRDDRATPARLRRLPSRLLTQTAMHADRLVNEGLARADDRKWHYAVLAALQEFGPASQAALSRRTGIYRSDLVAVINELAGRGLIERAPDQRHNPPAIQALGIVRGCLNRRGEYRPGVDVEQAVGCQKSIVAVTSRYRRMTSYDAPSSARSRRRRCRRGLVVPA